MDKFIMPICLMIIRALCTQMKKLQVDSYSCHIELVVFMFVVAMGPDSHCKTMDSYPLDAGLGYISSTMMKRSRYGMASCPWQISTNSGQHVQLDLFAFNKTELRSHCGITAVVKDGTSHHKINLCKRLRLNERPEYVYRSKGNQLTVYFEPFSQQYTMPIFLLRYRGM